jgi:ketosteroid isomerase-like protein
MTSGLDALNHVIETGESDDFLACLAPGAVVWHNHDDLEVDAIDNLKGIGMLQEMVDGVRVDVVRRAEIPGGEFAQVVMRGTVKATGRQLAGRNCLFVFETDGKITRIDEYVDPTFVQQLTQPAPE